jgi:hypothetical protein
MMKIPSLLLCFMLLAIAFHSRAEPVSSVRVGVYAEHNAGKVTYTYRVVNNSAQTISAIAIGRVTSGETITDELTVKPAGWNSRTGVPQASASSPNGWRVNLGTMLESPQHAIIWEAANNASKLPAGQTLSKLSITVDKADTVHLQGHATISFADGNPASLTAPIERLDTSPPKLAINLAATFPAATDSRYTPVNVSFPLKGDNYDRLPEVRLEAITSNEPLAPDDILDASYGLDDRYFKVRTEPKGGAGRTYKISYSATDASGNSTAATATIELGQSSTKQKTSAQAGQPDKITTH